MKHILTILLLTIFASTYGQVTKCDEKVKANYTTTNSFPNHTRITRCLLSDTSFDCSNIDSVLYIDQTVDKSIRKLIGTKELLFIHPEISEIPPEIGDLQHLKSVSFELSNFEYLPVEFWSLKNLETLRFVKCFKFKTLPKDFEKLKKLKFFGYTYGSSLDFDPAIFNKLPLLTYISFDHSRIYRSLFEKLQFSKSYKVSWRR